MRRAFPRLPAGLVLAATLLPLCAFAAPLRLQLVSSDSSVKGIPALSAKAFKASTTSALTQAVKREKGKATLVRAGSAQEADVRVSGTLERDGKKFRLLYLLQTQQEPQLEKELAYELTAPRLNPRTMTAAARELIHESVKLEEARMAQASRPEPVVASAPEPTPQPEPAVASTTQPEVASTAPEAPQPAPEVASAPASAPTASAPVAEAPRESLESSAPVETFKMRQQPRVVIHSGLTGLWGAGTRSFGFGAVVEPKWNITDSFAAGARFDGGVTFGGRIVPQGTTSVAVGASAATLLKGEYLFFDSGVRPLVGLGAGMYILANQSVSAGNGGAGVAQSAGRFFGVAPQIGIDFGGVRLAATYNHILGADIVIEQNVSVGLQAERIQRNYVQLELSFRAFKFGNPRRPVASAAH